MATKMLDELEKKKSSQEAVNGGGALPVSGYRSSQSTEAGAMQHSPRTIAMQKYLSDTVGGVPTESDLLRDVREKLMNRSRYTYDHNTDPRFQQYLDTAKRSGKMAMRDTIAKASSMTGGYANSYAESAGQLAYNDYLQDANEMIPEFEELARARHEAETAALTDKYSILQNEHEAALDDYWTRFGIAREDWYNEQDRQTAEAQHADEKKQREIELLLAMGDYDALDKMGYNTSALRASAYSSGSGSSDSEEDEEGSGLYSFNRTKNEKKVVKNKAGDYEEVYEEVMVFTDPNGKEVVLEKGINPYTRSTNTDIKYGTFKNGYQPNHIVFNKGKNTEYAVKLESTGDQYPVEGRYQNIWKTVDKNNGKKTQYWIWDGRANKYIDWTAYYEEYFL